MSESTDYPSFEDALEQFRALAEANGASHDIIFVRSNDVALSGGRLHVPSLDEGAARRQAKSTYEGAVANRRGVLIYGLLPPRF